jgi:hypothetical protein
LSTASTDRSMRSRRRDGKRRRRERIERSVDAFAATRWQEATATFPDQRGQTPKPARPTTPHFPPVAVAADEGVRFK